MRWKKHPSAINGDTTQLVHHQGAHSKFPVGNKLIWITTNTATRYVSRYIGKLSFKTLNIGISLEIPKLVELWYLHVTSNKQLG